MKPVNLVGVTIEVTTGTPAAVLRELDAPYRLLPIFIGEAEATSIALAVAGGRADRPLTHDLMTTVLASLHAHVAAVEVTELREGAYHAQLALTSPSGTDRFDTRPSDAIALAVRVGAPLFVSDEVLDENGLVPDEMNGESIEDTVAAFRAELATLQTLDHTDVTDDPA